MSDSEILLKAIIDELRSCTVDEIIKIREEWRQEMASKKMSEAIRDFSEKVCNLVIEEKGKRSVA